MKNTIFFGNGLNRVSTNSVSWTDLLDKLKKDNFFSSKTLPYTMTYERIFMEKYLHERNTSHDELAIKELIAIAMKEQGSNRLFELIAKMEFDNYITTNYDYAFEKAIGVSSEKLSTEEIYSLRRKRAYRTSNGVKFLWNIHGEIDNPKSIMLGLDHYCGSMSKIESYIKGNYKYSFDGEEKKVSPMSEKLKSFEFCYTSWVDLFFSSNIHIVGFSLDYSEMDIWWILNKRARFLTKNLIKNKVYFYTNSIDEEKMGLLRSFDVEVVTSANSNFESMYWKAIKSMLKKRPR